MLDRKRILVLGAGAIGGYVGSSLAQAGHHVVFYCRPATAALVRENGYGLEHGGQTVRVNPGVAETPELALESNRYDLLIVAVKRYDTADVVEPLRPYVDSIAQVLCLQNGIGAEEVLAEIFGKDRVLPGTVTTAVSRPAPNRVRVDRFRGIGIAGDGETARFWTAAFNQAGLNCRQYPDPGAMKWSKLVTNLIANPSSAILDLPPAEIYAHRGLFRLEIRQLREALAVMRAQDISVVDLPGTPVRLLAFCARYLPLSLAQLLLSRALGKGRGDKMPSFHSDLHGGSGKSEIDVLHGEVVRSGQRLGVPTPVNALLVDTLHALLEGALDPGVYRGRPEKLLDKLA